MTIQCVNTLAQVFCSTVFWGIWFYIFVVAICICGIYIHSTCEWRQVEHMSRMSMDHWVIGFVSVRSVERTWTMHVSVCLCVSPWVIKDHLSCPSCLLFPNPPECYTGVEKGTQSLSPHSKTSRPSNIIYCEWLSPFFFSFQDMHWLYRLLLSGVLGLRKVDEYLEGVIFTYNKHATSIIFSVLWHITNISW